MRICLFSFTMHNAQKHSFEFLKDVISFTHTYLEHLEEFSKGRMLKIKTGRRRKVKRNKKAKGKKQAALGDEDEDDDVSMGSDGEPAKKEKADGEFDPNKPDDDFGSDDEDGHGQIEDTFHDAEMDEESDQEVNVERQLNFNAEISLLINYDVI